MSSPQFVFKFPNFIRQFSSGTIYTLSPLSPLRLPYTRRSFRAETLLQPVPNHVVVFQRKSTVKKKKRKKPIGVLFRNTIDSHRRSPSPSIFIFPSLIPHHSFATSRRRPSRVRGGECIRRALVPSSTHFRTGSSSHNRHTTSVNNIRGTFDLRGHRGIP